ncbi:hypothetical protein [Paraflavitalea sp. CAU 1676]|uniref:hypothetical protein n=1 Tax=Paraflavitalea sp. CAU 1676 TaxID=3032598 RepID=UPI0023DBA1E4|nr:hypothetical protein [Paraflavitalea sp. CAU 1676]MDF2193679.1 hypothetical protein [Paraflavitalea sp. CAU 1676]
MQKKNKPIDKAPDGRQPFKEPASHPMVVFAKFCDNYQLQEAKDILWEWLVTALGKSPSLYDEGSERSHLFFFYENMEALIEAVHTIQAKQDQRLHSSPKPPDKKE